jgi:hypothetical protein
VVESIGTRRYRRQPPARGKLGTERQGAIEFVKSRGLTVVGGPETIEDLLEDVRTRRELRAR